MNPAYILKSCEDAHAVKLADIRDRFAAEGMRRAPQPIEITNIDSTDREYDFDQAARYAYAFADAMMRARSARSA